MKSLIGSFTLQRTFLTVIIGAFTVVAHTASPQNPRGRTLPSKKVRSVRDSFANAKPATIWSLPSAPQMRCRNERQRLAGLMTELRALQGLPPTDKRRDKVIDPS
jgi:hypothetical protein